MVHCSVASADGIPTKALGAWKGRQGGRYRNVRRQASCHQARRDHVVRPPDIWENCQHGFPWLLGGRRMLYIPKVGVPEAMRRAHFIRPFFRRHGGQRQQPSLDT